MNRRSLVILGRIVAPLLALAGVAMLVMLPPSDRLWAWGALGLAVAILLVDDILRRRAR